MKHKLTLTDEDGVILGQWTIEDEWGDIINKSIPRQVMASDISDELKRDINTQPKAQP